MINQLELSFGQGLSWMAQAGAAHTALVSEGVMISKPSAGREHERSQNKYAAQDRKKNSGVL